MSGLVQYAGECSSPYAEKMQCDEQLRRRITANLAEFDVVENKVDDAHHAAVALCVTDLADGPELPGIGRHEFQASEAGLILTRRSAKLQDHPGQWALPGGRLDPGETPVQTALREMREEIGLALPPERVLGLLDDFVTRSGFVMTPVVVWGGADVELEPNPEEVASVHRIPLREFLRPDAPMLKPVAGSEHPMLRMPVGSTSIAAPTAALLYQFREACLLGRGTRVAHFEQPAFAWR